MRRVFAIGFIAFLLMQQGPPDYAVRSLQPARVSNNEIVIQFDVVNFGGPAATTGVTALLITDQGEEVDREPVPPLQAQESVTLTLSFPVARFPVGSTQSIRISLAGLEEVEAPIPDARENNTSAPILVTIPAPGAQPSDASAAEGMTILGFPIDLSNPIYIAVLAGVLLAGIFLVIIIVAILRILFQRPAAFGAWQPPYASTPFLDPNTTAGRRQGWQQFAQNDLLPPPPTAEGATHVRKLLTGLDGTSLGNWRITALRLNQYDQYGRITRSQYIAPGRLVKRLNRVARQAPSLSADDLARRVHPIAGSLANRFVRNIVPRTATLPIALDIRLQGRHGEVRVTFELFYVQGGQWRKIDQWEPEIALVDQTIDENLTYTLYGLRAGEAYKSFPQRLQGDLTRLLVEMMKRPDAQRAPTPGAVNAVQTP